ncbi:MAG TPA: two-component regulator propeller domain-containing protein, partial [Anaerolineales bacterium]|nr:two-component regulator propeller domain-containing protein [Anaerolineales bacterium]
MNGKFYRFLCLSLLACFLLAPALNVHAAAPAARAPARPAEVDPPPPDDIPAPLPGEPLVDLTGPPLRFERLPVEQGHSPSGVFSILQDRYGFMWFGAGGGLSKYDGYTFTAYEHNPQDPTSLSHNTISAVMEDSAGRVWVGSYGGGLNRFERDRREFVRYRSSPNDPTTLTSDYVSALYEDSRGLIWVGATGGGLNRYDPAKDRFKRFTHDPDDPASLSNDNVNSIYEDRDGVLWIGTNGGLNRYDPQTERFSAYRHQPDNPLSLSDDDVYAIHEDRAGVLWIGTDGGGLNAFDRRAGRFTRYLSNLNNPYSLSSSNVSAIYEDSSGLLWVGTLGGGLNQFDRQNQRFFRYMHDPNDPHSLSNNYINTLYEDQSGILWIGTAIQLNKLDRRSVKFRHIQSSPSDPNSLSSNAVYELFEDSRGILWVGADRGLNRLDPGADGFTRYFHDPLEAGSLPDDRVTALAEDQLGFLWVGTAGGGLARFDLENESFFGFHANPFDPNSLSSDSINDLYIDPEGVLWIATDAGLNRYDRARGRFQVYNVYAKESERTTADGVTAILQDRFGYLWLGTDGSGLVQFDPLTEEMNHYIHRPVQPDSLGFNAVSALYEDSAGRLWVGTKGAGLDLFDRQRGVFFHYREAEGLSDNTVAAILEDGRGNLWISTKRGLNRFNPDTEIFHHFDAGDGLQSDEFYPSATLRRDGEMLFGGINGYNAFYAQDVQENPYRPPVALTALTIEGQPALNRLAPENIREITLTWPERQFAFTAAALSYAQPEQNQYAFMLEGYDRGWRYVGTNRDGSYTNLPGGDYTLRIQASNHDGVWNDQGLALKVKVQPPFWQNTWVAAGGFVLLLGSVAGGYLLRARAVQTRNRELEDLIRTRTFEIERRRQVAEGLREILFRINAERTLEESLMYILQEATRLTGAETAFLFRHYGAPPLRVLAQAQRFEPQKAADPPLPVEAREWISKLLIKRGPVAVLCDGVGNAVIVDGQSKRLSNLSLAQGRSGEPLPFPRYCALLCVPLNIGDENFGGLVLLYRDQATYSVDDIELGATFADQAALAIANARLREHAEQSAVEAERSRLARDLHDSAKQQAFAALAQLGAANALMARAPAQAQEHVQEAESLVHEVLQELATLIQEMHPVGLQDRGLPAALKDYTYEWSDHNNIPITVAIK